MSQKYGEPYVLTAKGAGVYRGPFLRVMEKCAVDLWYRGNIGLLTEQPVLAIIGSRAASVVGVSRAMKTAQIARASGWVVMSGLAAGIDTAALSGAIADRGRVIGVIGTPLTKHYPVQNSGLQDLIGRDHLLVSHLGEQDESSAQAFRYRNKVMAALATATLLIECGEHSGTKHQIQACADMGKPIVTLESTQSWKWLREAQARQGKRSTLCAASEGGLRDILRSLERDWPRPLSVPEPSTAL